MGEYKFRKNNFTQFHKNHIKLCKFCHACEKIANYDYVKILINQVFNMDGNFLTTSYD